MKDLSIRTAESIFDVESNPCNIRTLDGRYLYSNTSNAEVFKLKLSEFHGMKLDDVRDMLSWEDWYYDDILTEVERTYQTRETSITPTNGFKNALGYLVSGKRIHIPLTNDRGKVIAVAVKIILNPELRYLTYFDIKLQHQQKLGRTKKEIVQDMLHILKLDNKFTEKLTVAEMKLLLAMIECPTTHEQAHKLGVTPRTICNRKRIIDEKCRFNINSVVNNYLKSYS